MKTADYFPTEEFPFEREKHFMYGNTLHKMSDVQKMVVAIVDSKESFPGDIANTIIPLFACFRIIVYGENLNRKEAENMGLRVVSAVDGQLKPYEFIKRIIEDLPLRIGYETVDEKMIEVFRIKEDDGGYELRNLLLWYLNSCIIWGQKYLEDNSYRVSRCKFCGEIFVCENQGGRYSDFCSDDCRNRQHNKNRNKHRREKKEKGASENGNDN